MLVFAAPDWHFWIAVALTPVAFLLVLSVVVGYFVKVVAPRYPPRGQRRP